MQVEGYITEGGKKLASPRLKGFWDSHLEAVPQEGPPKLLWRAKPIPEENLKNWCGFSTQRSPNAKHRTEKQKSAKQGWGISNSRLCLPHPAFTIRACALHRSRKQNNLRLRGKPMIWNIN